MCSLSIETITTNDHRSPHNVKAEKPGLASLASRPDGLSQAECQCYAAPPAGPPCLGTKADPTGYAPFHVALCSQSPFCNLPPSKRSSSAIKSSTIFLTRSTCSVCNE